VGLTLIEVVAAIAILGGILVGIVLAHSRHTRQLTLAERQQAAVRAADELITRWRGSERGVPVGREGVVPFDEALRWRTRLVESEPIARVGGRVVRVSLHVAEPATSSLDPADHKLVTVDLVLPKREDGGPVEPGGRAEGGGGG